MKKTLTHLFAIAAIGLALTACGGHHEREHEHEHETQDQPTTTTDDTKREHHSDNDNPEHKETPAKTEVPTEKGTPKVDTVLPEKPKDESTMGSTPTKHHVKPGGVQGTK